MKPKNRLPSMKVTYGSSGTEEEKLKTVLESCPTYHCRTRQLRPDRVFYIEFSGKRLAVCHVCYDVWHDLHKSQSELIARRQVNAA